MAESRANKLIFAFVRGMMVSALLAGMFIVAWIIHRMLSGGISNLNLIAAMMSNAMIIFIVCTAMFTATFALVRRRDPK